MAASAIATIDAPFHVVGHSMGGRVAFEIVDMAPEQVASLVVLDTGVHPVAEGEPAKRQALIDRARANGVSTLAQTWLPPMVHPDRHADHSIMDPMAAMVSSYTIDDYVGQVTALLGRRDLRALLPTITCPTLVVCGQQDAWSTVEQHEALAERIPDARLEIVED